MKKTFLSSFTAACIIISFPTWAENTDNGFFTNKLPSLIKNVADGFKRNQGSETLESEAANLSVDLTNSAIDKAESSILSNSNFTHFEFVLGTDILGLDGDGRGTSTEAMTVYKLHETDELFIFNQTSLTNFDGRTTLNLGFGARSINEADTVILGGNAFYDYEFDSEHKRASLGVELLTSQFEIRANKYLAQSNKINYKNIDETALDGHDIKLTALLPYFYSSNLYFKTSEFKDSTYKLSLDEWGAQAEFAPNLFVSVGQQKKNDSDEETVASIKYSIALGQNSNPNRTAQDGKWRTKFVPIKEKLYQPVQRENRIVKKAVKLGVTMSGA
jgi:hypothetical protein